MFKVINVRCHVGAQIGAKVYTSIDAEKEGFEMQMVNNGVFVYAPEKGKVKEKQYFIPHSTIASVQIERADYVKFMNGPLFEEKKEVRKGRPPKE